MKKFTVHYIPLDKIKSGFPAQMTERIRKLRSLLWDCMHLLVVRKSKDDDSYVLLSGANRYEYLRKHTNKTVAPCIIDENDSDVPAHSWFYRFRHRRLLHFFPHLTPHKLLPASRSILRDFLREEPKFARLSRTQQLKVLVLAVRYRRTVVLAMRAMVDRMLRQSGK